MSQKISRFSTKWVHFLTWILKQITISWTLNFFFQCVRTKVNFSLSQTFAVSRMLCAFFWVIPWRLNFICRRFGTLCLFHLHRRVGMKEKYIFVCRRHKLYKGCGGLNLLIFNFCAKEATSLKTRHLETPPPERAPERSEYENEWAPQRVCDC
jgi:hypothetical protein